MQTNQTEQVGGKRKLDLLAVYVQPEVKLRLEEWAKKKDRSISWIVARLVDEALAADRDKDIDKDKL